MNIEIIKAKTNQDLILCSNLRKKVFGDEQNAQKSLYLIDEYDKKSDSIVYLLMVNNDPVGTVRLVKIDDETCRLARFVILKEHRNKGYAKMLLKRFEEDAINIGYKKIILSSCEAATGFYEKNGYKPVSDVYYEEQRARVNMEKYL